MRIHIQGICGTFMGGVARLARALGHEVTGSDQGVYPPMSTQLEELGVALRDGYHPANLDPRPDLVVIGNALSRGNPEVEAVLDQDIPYISGAQWVAEHVLRGRHVLACAGTHGKTTTSSMLAWILEAAGLSPGFLIGGVPENFGVTARLGESKFFVIEADEYDTAFFDKRSKFVHYHPRTLLLNNLEFDHADIFPDLAAIRRQFHYLVRTIPASGRIVVNGTDRRLQAMLREGCWTPLVRFGVAAGWSGRPVDPECSRFLVAREGTEVGEVRWSLIGHHNMTNALGAIASAVEVGVPVDRAIAALAGFRNTRRRLEVCGKVNGITVYDDFAHHPTAITATLEALRARVGNGRIVAVLELRSNTMRMGVHQDTLGPSLAQADRVFVKRPKEMDWSLEPMHAALAERGQILAQSEEILAALGRELKAGDSVLIMSNGGFDGIHQRLIRLLTEQALARGISTTTTGE